MAPVTLTECVDEVVRLRQLNVELQAAMDTAVLRIIRQGRARCGAGFGKYPLGLRDALRELVPSLVNTEAVLTALKDLDDRLAR